MSSLNATNAPFIVGFIVLVSSRRDTASQHGKGCNISVTHLRYSANYNALDSWPIRAHLTSQNDELCKNWQVTIMYSMWKIMCFLNLEPRKYIALHQIHKIMFFLATSYDPYNKNAAIRRWTKVIKTWPQLLNEHFSATHWTFYFENATKRAVRYVISVL